MIVSGVIRVPGDKSISHRALLLAWLAAGTSRIRGIPASSDITSTARVLRALGVALPPLGGEIVLIGSACGELRKPDRDLNCGNSGTTARLTAGLAAAQRFESRFVGDPSLSRRPMQRVARPLRAMGASVMFENGDGLPMTVGGGTLRAVEWSSETPSAQVKSAILLAACVAGVTARINEPQRSRDHTERLLAHMGARLVITPHSVDFEPCERLAPIDLEIPGDPSSAAYFAALATLARSGTLEVRDVCLNETRTGFYGILGRMCGDVTLSVEREVGGEPVGMIQAGPAQLSGVDISEDEIPSVIDELPLLACLAARAEGTTSITGASELRVKESDRIATVVSNLRELGVAAEELPDGMRITGTPAPLAGKVRAHGDHRLAMAFGVLATEERNAIEIDDPECVAISYPAFWTDIRSVVT